MNWWVYYGYKPFDAGKDGYPLPGQVVKYYREVRGATQLNLAQELHRSKNTVRSMQNQGTALDSFSLRLRLSTLYDMTIHHSKQLCSISIKQSSLLNLSIKRSCTPPSSIVEATPSS